MTIQPTVGRIVWYRPFSHEPGSHPGAQPLAAIVTHVWSDTCVNLAIFDPNGGSYGRTSVLLVQDGGHRPGSGFCEWMPYQKGQAAKTESLEAKLSAA